MGKRERGRDEKKAGSNAQHAHPPFPPSSTPQAKRGGFKDTPPDDMLAAVITATLQRTGVEPEVSLMNVLFFG